MLFKNHLLWSIIHSQLNRFFWDWAQISIAILKFKSKSKRKEHIAMTSHLWGFNEFYLSSGNSMMVWNFPWSAAGPSPTSIYLFSVTIGEVTWACVRAWASSNVSSLADGEETRRDLGLDREALERKKNREESQTFLHGEKIQICVSVCIPIYLYIHLSIYLHGFRFSSLSFLNSVRALY